MSGYLESLVNRQQGEPHPITPRLPSRYEPVRWPMRAVQEDPGALAGVEEERLAGTPEADSASAPPPRLFPPQVAIPVKQSVASDWLTVQPTRAESSLRSFGDRSAAIPQPPPERPRMLESPPSRSERPPFSQAPRAQALPYGATPAEPDLAPSGPVRTTASTGAATPRGQSDPESDRRSDPESVGAPPALRPQSAIHPIARIEPPIIRDDARPVPHRSSRLPHEPDRTVVEVTIGRIEVRAVPQAARPAAPCPEPTTMSLEEYLRRRSGESR